MKLCPTLLHEADKQKSDLKSYECIFYATAIQFVQIELFEKVTYFRMTTFYCCLLLLVLNADQQARRNFSISPGKKTIFSASVHSSLSIKNPIQVNFFTRVLLTYLLHGACGDSAVEKYPVVART